MIVDITLVSIFGMVVYCAHLFIKEITAREQAKILETRKLNNIE